MIMDLLFAQSLLPESDELYLYFKFWMGLSVGLLHVFYGELLSVALILYIVAILSDW